MTRLVAIGYFRDEVEGSQLWNELENKAADTYVETRREEYVYELNLKIMPPVDQTIFGQRYVKTVIRCLVQCRTFSCPRKASRCRRRTNGGFRYMDECRRQ